MPVAKKITTRSGGGIFAAGSAVKSFLAEEFDAREIRITRVEPPQAEHVNWEVEAQLLVPDLTVKALGIPVTQEVLKQGHCRLDLDPQFTVVAFEFDD